MATPVVMPQMGESIAEGTIVRWIKKVGDTVDRDEPLFEISTDKVDAEIPSPAAGVLTDIKVHEGETVAVNSVVAEIGEAGAQVSAAAAAGPATDAHQADVGSHPAPATAAPSSDATVPQRGTNAAAASAQPQGDGTPRAREATPPDNAARAGAAARTPAASPSGSSGEGLSRDELRRQKSSPLVRKIAQENHVDIRHIAGSGIGGRVTKHDILSYIDQHPEGESSHDARPQPSVFKDGAHAEVRPLSIMRKKIAEHMILSRRTSAHVHTVFQVNFSTVDKLRQQKKAEYESRGARLTYMSFIAKAVVDALRRHPLLNASIDGDNVVYKKDINLGIAVALEGGLIVPVVSNADEKNLLGLTRAIADVAERARAKQLKPEEVHNGTFTITNPGQFGAQFGLPIINQPQVAILGVGTIEKRPVVIDDAIAVRPMGYLALGFDHRLVDGAVADQFMADIRQQLERFDPGQV